MSVREVEFGREFHAVLNTKVFLSLKTLFKGVELVVGECRSSLPHLLRLAASVALLRRNFVATVALVVRKAFVAGVVCAFVTSVCRREVCEIRGSY